MPQLIDQKLLHASTIDNNYIFIVVMQHNTTISSAMENTTPENLEIIAFTSKIYFPLKE